MQNALNPAHEEEAEGGVGMTGIISSRGYPTHVQSGQRYQYIRLEMHDAGIDNPLFMQDNCEVVDPRIICTM